MMMSMRTIQSHGQFSPFNTTRTPSLSSPSPSEVSLVTRFEIPMCEYKGKAGLSNVGVDEYYFLRTRWHAAARVSLIFSSGMTGSEHPNGRQSGLDVRWWADDLAIVKVDKRRCLKLKFEILSYLGWTIPRHHTWLHQLLFICFMVI